jgi:hypothetical protein
MAKSTTKKAAKPKPKTYRITFSCDPAKFGEQFYRFIMGRDKSVRIIDVTEVGFGGDADV